MLQADQDFLYLPKISFTVDLAGTKVVSATSAGMAVAVIVPEMPVTTPTIIGSGMSMISSPLKRGK